MKPLLTLAGAAAVALALAGQASPQAPGAAEDALLQARRISMKLRTGQYHLAPQSVALLEAAVRASPEDIRLWNALGTAYFEQLQDTFRKGDLASIPVILRKATAAHARALELDPDDPAALSGHGTGLAIASGFVREPEMGRRGVSEMDRAIERGPNNTMVRLQRGFTNLNLPPEVRNAAGAEADLEHLIEGTDGSRAADVLHVLLGDLQLEGGRHESARAQYLIAARPASAAREMAQLRLDRLARGQGLTAETQQLRTRLGRDCAMCHGSGPVGGISTP